MRPLDGKVALVTGSTGGIGYSIARRLAQDGARVVMHGTSSAEKAEPARRELADSAHTDVAYVSADITRPDDIARMIGDIKSKFGPVDILVNNAGIGKVCPFETLSKTDWDNVMAVNVTGPFLASQAVVPDMKEKGWGRIVNIGSVHSLVAAGQKAAYTASKHALLGLTKEIAMEVAENGITCNVVSPGYVKTPMVEGRIKEEAARLNMTEDQWVKTVMLKEQALKRFVSPEEVADTVAFLCGPGSGAITGGAIAVDGGWTAH